MKSVYVACSSKEMDRARAAFDMVRGSPHVNLAFDWIAQIEAVGDANPPPKKNGEDIKLRRHWAQQAMGEAALADILWVLLPESETVGLWFEFATVALANMQELQNDRSRIVVSGSQAAYDKSIFISLADFGHGVVDDKTAFLAYVDKGCTNLEALLG